MYLFQTAYIHWRLQSIRRFHIAISTSCACSSCTCGGRGGNSDRSIHGVAGTRKASTEVDYGRLRSKTESLARNSARNGWLQTARRKSNELSEEAPRKQNKLKQALGKFKQQPNKWRKDKLKQAKSNFVIKCDHKQVRASMVKLELAKASPYSTP